MKIIETEFKGVFIFEPAVYEDTRGSFMESFNAMTLKNQDILCEFVQDNQSFSKKGVLRGLHFQKKPFDQTKLVRVLSGKILDVIVDLREQESTFKKTFSVELSQSNNKQLFVPKGFAHGFVVLSETANVLYKCDQYYYPKLEGGIHYNDRELKIDWQFDNDRLIVSEKDKALPMLTEMNYRF
jgi:dTDP-4-dehydrorhamnose 3,5-epimerase